MWFKYGLKAQKLLKQHALNQRSPAEGKGKGQKLLAQGIALGIMAISKAPCKVGCSKFESKSGIKNSVILVHLSC